MTGAIVVRQATLADLEALASLLDGYRGFYGCSGNLAAARNFLHARFEHGDSVLLIATADGLPAGFAQLYPSLSTALLARADILNDVYVHP